MTDFQTVDLCAHLSGIGTPQSLGMNRRVTEEAVAALIRFSSDSPEDSAVIERHEMTVSI